MKFLVEQVERVTGLRNFGIYMNQLFTIDALFLNEDRHTHNMAVLMDGEGRFLTMAARCCLICQWTIRCQKIR